MFHFQIEKSHINGCEAKIISLYCLKNNLKKEFVIAPTFNKDTIPFGGVDFCEKFYGKHFLPNYYPEFLNRLISRRIWKFDEVPLENCFIKPADKYKRFCGKISSELKKEERIGPFWCSEIVNFDKEWRIYVVNGEILASYFYLGEDEDIPPPEIKTKFPKNFCGAVDFGLLNNRIELIESHHPFAIGWYGGFSGGEKYIKFLKAGHKYLLTLTKKRLS